MQIQSKSYNSFFTEVKSLIREARFNGLKAVIEQLSKDLQAEYPGQRGWSTRNLWIMKPFYEVYKNN